MKNIVHERGIPDSLIYLDLYITQPQHKHYLGPYSNSCRGYNQTNVSRLQFKMQLPVGLTDCRIAT